VPNLRSSLVLGLDGLSSIADLFLLQTYGVGDGKRFVVVAVVRIASVREIPCDWGRGACLRTFGGVAQ
jgi:hypothetical protein